MRLISSLATIVVVVLIVYFVGFREDITLDGDPRPVDNQKPISLTGAYLTDFAGNEVKWNISAATAEIFQNRDVTMIQGMRAEILGKPIDNKPTIVQSDFGQIEGKQNRMIMWDNVIVELGDGRRVYTREVEVDQRRDLMVAKYPVKLVSPTETLLGDSMRYNLKTEILNLSNPKAEVLLKL